MSEEITFRDLLEIAETAFRERYLSALLETLSKLASNYEYYLNVRQEDIVMAYYDTSFEYKAPPHSILVTIVLKSGIAVKVTVDREKESDKIARVAVWVVPVE